MEMLIFNNAQIKSQVLHFETCDLKDYSLEDFCLLSECSKDSLNFKKILTYKSFEKICLLSNFIDSSKLTEDQNKNLKILRDMYANFQEYPLYVKIRQPTFSKKGTCTRGSNIRMTLLGGYDFVCPERMPRKVNYTIKTRFYEEIIRNFRCPESPVSWNGGSNNTTSDFLSKFKRGDEILEEEWWEIQ